MSRYDHKIETSLEGIEHLSKGIKYKIISCFPQTCCRDHWISDEITFRKNIAKDRKVIPDPIDDRKFQE